MSDEYKFWGFFSIFKAKFVNLFEKSNVKELIRAYLHIIFKLDFLTYQDLNCFSKLELWSFIFVVPKRGSNLRKKVDG